MSFDRFLSDFTDYPQLRQRVLDVLNSLPTDVQNEFLNDVRFQVRLEDFVPGRGWTLFMPVPGPPGSGSRCVVLRAKLERLPEQFATWVIAHEFAHAILNNGGWGEITDREEAADALAASWGFERPG